MAVLVKSDSDPLPHTHAAGFGDDADEDSVTVATMMTSTTGGIKATPNTKPRRVSFPVDGQLITGYVEPPNPWEKAMEVTRQEVVTAYINACNRYNLTPLAGVVQQLQNIERFDERVDCLDLHGEKLSGSHMETLEEVFKRVQFVTVNLENTTLDDESSLPLFDMLEYYDSARVLNISRNQNISVQGWQACCRMIKRTGCLEQLLACNIALEEENVRILQRTLKLNPNLTVLRLNNCGISGRLLATLMNGLKANKALRELHLTDNQISCSDGVQLAQLLRSNLQLKLLNLSGNQLEDQGIGHLAEGLGDQNQVQLLLKLNKRHRGLKTLLLKGNRMTYNSVGLLAEALMDNSSLEMLDLSSNNISNEGIYLLKEPLMKNRSLLQLKLNDCRITCEGAVALAEFVAENPKIQELDLRENSIRMGGLLALVQSMKVNQSVTKLELDVPALKDSPGETEQRRQLLLQLSEYSDRNSDILEKRRDVEEELVGDDLEENKEDDFVSEPVSKLLSLWSHPPPKRPSSVTCHPPIRVSSVAESPPEPGGWQSLRGSAHYHHYLRSPQPSPSSSPIPSPTRNRFHVTRVFQEMDNNSSLEATPTTVVRPSAPNATAPSRVKFIVTPVIDVSFEEPPVVSSSISSVTSSSSSSPQPEEQRCEGEESSDNDSVFLDPPLETNSSSINSLVGLIDGGEDKGECDDNCNGDRDSGIYLLDVTSDDLETANSSAIAVPNEKQESQQQHSSSSNNELIDRLLQDSSCQNQTMTLVDVGGDSYSWSEPSSSSSVEIVDFLTEVENTGCWPSSLSVTGDLITFSEQGAWLSQPPDDDSRTRPGDSLDGGESNGSSDSGVTEVDYVALEDVICSNGSQSETDNEKTPLRDAAARDMNRSDGMPGAHKLKNGYRSVVSQQNDESGNGVNNAVKRNRTPGCAGSKELTGNWTA